MSWDFWSDNKDAILTILAILGVLGAVAGTIWAAFKWGILRWWNNRIRVDVKVFEVISNPGVLLPKLYATENDDSPLADHNIKYQPRDPKQDLQAELKAALNRSRYLLVTAPTGYGKTREAGMLAQTMMLEGWRVLRIRTGWLDVPKTLPEELNSNRSRVLIFLDDLNGLFSTGNLTQSPRVENEKTLMLSQLSYHDRLLQMLDMFEGMCTQSEIRVIATARSEAEQWKLLDYDENDSLWKRFERIKISEPADIAIVNLLEDTIKQADLKANESEFEAIAHKSDGTYRNILLNLRRFRSQNMPVSKDNFTDTLDGSWKDIYERAISKHSAVEYIYDAIDILQQAGVELFPILVEPTATAVWGGNRIQKVFRQRKVQDALWFLTEETRIIRTADKVLAPSDGQIEARQKSISWNPFEKIITNLLLEKKIRLSLLAFATVYSNQGKTEKARQLMSQLVKINPSDQIAYSRLGFYLDRLGLTAEAEEAYRKTTELGTTSSDDYFFWGTLLEDLKHNSEAEIAYRKAIELNPLDKLAYSFLGNLLLNKLNRPDEAEIVFQKNIELNPLDSDTYRSLGRLFQKLKRYDEAEVVYHKAIDVGPLDSNTYKDLGILLRDLERYDEAETAYCKAIDLNPADKYAYFFLGSLLNYLNRLDEAEVVFSKVIELDPTLAAAHNVLGVLLRNLKRYEEAETSFRKAIELNPTSAKAYQNLAWLLRSDLKGRLEETLPLLEKLIEIDSEDWVVYLAVTSISKQLGSDVSHTYLERARQFIPDDDLYSRACLESICDNFDLAFEYLQRAAQNEEFNPIWAWEDPDLQWIRDDPRFVEIVGPKPEK